MSVAERGSMSCQQDDDELYEWLKNAAAEGGKFLKLVAEAGLCADPHQYEELRPGLLGVKSLYPDYAKESRPKGYPTGD